MKDTIYRQMAIDAMLKLQAEDDEAYGCRIPEGFDGDRAKEALEQLPSAQPEVMYYPQVDGITPSVIVQHEQKGKWVHDGYDIPHGVDWMHCSVCGRREPYVPAAMTNYCPNCGADMREGENE